MSTNDESTWDVFKAKENGLSRNLHPTDVSIVSENDHVLHRSDCDTSGSGLVLDVKLADQPPGHTIVSTIVAKIVMRSGTMPKLSS